MLSNYKPSSLQGNLNRNKYFEGWFQKVYSVQHKASFIIIYGYATRNSSSTFGFIQVHIPNQQPILLHFPKNEVSCDPDQHLVQMGKHILTTQEIKINTSDINLELNLINNKPIQTFKNSMGYNYFIPSLPCYHSVLNKSHGISGEIRNGKVSYTLDNELGYLEKNWGTSFPEKYIWLHAVDPSNPEVNLLFSQAEIKWMGKTFIKHVGYFHFLGEHIDLRLLKNCSISISYMSPEKQLIQILSKSVQLGISITLDQQVLFKGPQDGSLSRDILHYIDAHISVQLTQQGLTRSFQLIGNYENIGELYPKL